MNDGLIGLIILIAVLNIVGRIVKGISRASRQAQQGPRRDPGLAELLQKLQTATEGREGTPEEQPVLAEDEGPFAWLRDVEEKVHQAQEPIPPAPGETSEDIEFLSHPEPDYALDDSLVVEPVPVDMSEETFERVPGMPLETPFERPDLTAPAGIDSPSRGFKILVGRRFTDLQRAVVYSEILRPCIASRKKPSMRRYA